MIRLLNRRVLVFVLAVSLTLPLVPLGDDTANATHTDCHELRNHPLFIRSVEVTEELPSSDDDTFLPGEGAVFAEPGAELAFEVLIQNRYDDASCADQATGFPDEMTDQLQIEIRYHDIDGEDGPVIDSQDFSDCGDSTSEGLEPGQQCTQTIRLPTSLDGEVQAPSTSSNEQRIRLVVFDDDAEESGEINNCATDDSSTATDPNVGACTGAERIIVSDALPDLTVDDITIPGDPRTSYDQSQDMSAEVTLANDGDYANWNPNGARGEGEFWERSSFDADGDGQPEETGAGEHHWSDVDVPTCKSDADPWEGLSDTTRCSYRRGLALETPVWYELRRTDDDSLLEEDAVDFYSDNALSGPENDKDFSILAGETDIRTRSLISLYKRAGQFQLTMEADRDQAEVPEGEFFHVPESNENNNQLIDTVDILGVDLKISDDGVVVQTPDGGTQEEHCLNPDNPCPVDGSVIRYDPEYRNVGDSAVDGELTDRKWRGGVYLNGEMVDWRNQSDVPHTDEDERSLFDLTRELTPESGGGPHKIEVRLDHRDNYAKAWEGFVDEPQGRVGERTEGNECPEGSGLDNTHCITFYFEDQDPPEVTGSRIIYETSDGDQDETSNEDGDTPRITENSNVTFEADVEDSAIVSVKADFEYTNGTEANLTGPDGETFSELEMTQVEDTDTWNVSTQLSGNLTRYEYKVQAADINNTAVHTFGEFELTQVPIDIEVDPPGGGGFEVNGESSFGSDPPRYEGTAEDPQNWFNITASINGTGHSDEDVVNHTSVEVISPNGTTAAWADVNYTERCVVVTEIAGEEQDRRFDHGPNCQEAREDETENVTDSWGWYYANSTEQDIDLRWAGWFDVVYHVEDEFDRNATGGDRSGRIADRLNDDGNEQAILRNDTITPTDVVDPGGQVEASVDAFDVLGVEEAVLNISKPGDDTVVRAPLEPTTETRSNATGNGTYEASFDVDPSSPYFDRGGTYEVQIEVEDFAGNVNETTPPVELDVNDTDDPEIVEFRTIPNGTQEVGGPVTWVAQIEDETAIRPPLLSVDRPNSVSEGPLEMTFNETRDRWEHGPMDATDVDVGTWTYDLTVEDYTGKQARASGSIEIAENLPPQDENWAPDVQGTDGATYGPPDPTIKVDVVDYGQGVNLSSINFTLNGADLADEAEITEIDACQSCYRIKYTPEEAFDPGSTVDVTVEAADVSDPPRESDTMRHQFTVDAQPPRPDIQMGPAVTVGDQRVIGLPTDISVSLSDGGAGPGKSRVTVADADPDSGDATQTIELAGGEGTFRLQEFDEVVDGHGNYQIAVEGEDAVGNTADPLQRSVIFDKLGPSIEVFAEPGKPREVVFANVTDDAEIQEVVAKYSVDDGAEQTLSLQEEDGTWTVRLFNQRTDDAFQEGSTVRFTVEATDIFGNVRASPEKNFTAGDSVPEVSFADPGEDDSLTGTAELTWTASDAETATEDLRISLFYKIQGGTFQEIPDAQDIANTGSYRLDTTTLPNGDITLQVFVLDGQNFAADEVNVTVRNLGETFSAPQIEDARTEDGRDVLAPNQETTFRVQIDGNVRSARAEITRNGTVVQEIQLEGTGGTTYEGSFVAPTERGNYSIDLFAETDEGTEQAGSAYAFSVQGEPEGDNFIPEWTLLTALTATAVALGALGLRSRWT